MPTRPAFEGVNAEALEHLRIGTRDQFESEWRLIPALGSHAFTHALDEIPWLVDVIRSDDSDGKSAMVPTITTHYTFAKSKTAVTITNADANAAHYFRVRAM